MKHSQRDIVLVEGNNELNVGMTPIPVVSRFRYPNISCRSPWNEAGIHPIYDIECDVTNEGTDRETRIVQFWVHWDSTDRYYNPNSVEVTLDPGESYHYHYREGYLASNENCYGFVTDDHFEWEWPGGKRRPRMGDRSSGCYFKGGWR